MSCTPPTESEDSIQKLQGMVRSAVIRTPKGYRTASVPEQKQFSYGGQTVRSDTLLVNIVTDGNTQTVLDAFERQMKTTRWNQRVITAAVPLHLLIDIADHPNVRTLRPISRPIKEATTEAFEKLAAAQYAAHLPPYDGSDVQVAVVDTEFGGLSEVQALLELPEVTLSDQYICTEEGGSCTSGTSVESGDDPADNHGTAVTEILFDVVPSSSLSLFKTDSASSTAQAINTAVDNGVHVILMALGFEPFYVPLAGKGGITPGTQDLYDAIRHARTQGVLLVTSVGNLGERTYTARFSGNEEDCHIVFEDDTDINVVLEQDEAITIGLTWDEWNLTDPLATSAENDFDLFLLDENGTEVASAETDSTGSEPVEVLYYADSHSRGTYHIRICRSEDGGGSPEIRLTSLGIHPLSPFEPHMSLSSPADSPYAFSVGAAAVQNDAIETFSSKGPTSSGQIKPDMSSYDRVTTESRDLIGFWGSSAAAPHVAGVAAMYLSAQPDTTVVDLINMLRNSATQVGAVGPDNDYGWGLARLPDLEPPLITVISPTEERPVGVGRPNDPLLIQAQVEVSDVSGAFVSGLIKEDFGFMVGTSAATSLQMVEVEEKYFFLLQPPRVAATGTYDFTVDIDGSGIQSVTEKNAIVYTDESQGFVDVALVLDRSGSMSGSPLAAAKDAATLFVNMMRGGDRVSVVAFDDIASLETPLLSIEGSQDTVDLLSMDFSGGSGGWNLDPTWSVQPPSSSGNEFVSVLSQDPKSGLNEFYSLDFTTGTGNWTLEPSWGTEVVQGPTTQSCVVLTESPAANSPEEVDISATYDLAIPVPQGEESIIIRLDTQFDLPPSAYGYVEVYRSMDGEEGEGYWSSVIDIYGSSFGWTQRSAVVSVDESEQLYFRLHYYSSPEEIPTTAQGWQICGIDFFAGATEAHSANAVYENPVQLPGQTGAVVWLDTQYGLNDGSYGYVEVSQDGGTTWTNAMTVSGYSNGFTERTFGVVLNEAGRYHIRFRYVPGAYFINDIWEIGRIRVTSGYSGGRQTVLDAISSLQAGGGTSIGGGLQEGNAELIQWLQIGRPRFIVLLTDGEENAAPFIADVLPDLIQNNIAVCTIGFGGANEAVLQDVAESTGCIYFFAPTHSELASMFNQMSGAVTNRQDLFEVDGSALPGQVVHYPVQVDTSIEDMTFSVTWSADTLNRLYLELVTPNGTIYSCDQKPSEVTCNRGQTYVAYQVPHPEPGIWTVRVSAVSLPTTEGLNGNGQDSVSFTVNVSGSTDVTFDPFLGGSEISRGEPNFIRAALSSRQGLSSITAVVEVTLPDGTVRQMSLWDDGLHGDGQADDKVYAVNFTGTGSSGEYVVRVISKGKLSNGLPFERSGTAAFQVTSSSVDSDLDGLPDVWERFAFGNLTDGSSTGDYDLDGLTEAEELSLGTNPRFSDTDSDFLDDAQEVAAGTSPLNWDTDFGGVGDGEEVLHETDPLDPDTESAGPRIGLSVSKRIDFGNPDELETVTRTITVSNIGWELLQVSEAGISGSQLFGIQSSPSGSDWDIEPGDDIELTLSFTAPRDLEFEKAEFTMSTNDPESPSVKIQLVAGIDCDRVCLNRQCGSFDICDCGQCDDSSECVNGLCVKSEESQLDAGISPEDAGESDAGITPPDSRVPESDVSTPTRAKGIEAPSRPEGRRWISISSWGSSGQKTSGSCTIHVGERETPFSAILLLITTLLIGVRRSVRKL